MDTGQTPFSKSVDLLMEAGSPDTYAAYLERTVPPAYKPAFVQNQRSMPVGVLALVRLAVNLNPAIILQLVYGDFKEAVRCLYDLVCSMSLGKLDWCVVSRL